MIGVKLIQQIIELESQKEKVLTRDRKEKLWAKHKTWLLQPSV